MLNRNDNRIGGISRTLIVGGVLAIAAMAAPVFADGASDDVAPAPPSIGADVPLTYFGPAPSDVQKELIGPHQLLKSGKLDDDFNTITLPLYKGRMEGSNKTVWYIVTDTTDKWNADGLGINHSAKLQYANVGKGVRQAYLDESYELVFKKGEVDFSPKRSLTPGDAPAVFPPKSAQPGSVGDKDYTPLVQIQNAGGHTYNAPVLAFDVDADALDAFCGGDANHDITHDKVISICPSEGTVTLELTPGFSFSRPVMYISTDSNDPVGAVLEASTYAPAMNSLKVGGDDSLFSPVERIFVFLNGPTGADNPQRQGINSAIIDHRSPLNVLGGIPTIATDYSPLWDVNLGVWTDEAIAKGYRSRMTEEFAILGMAERGFITGPGGGKYGSTGIIVNCPIVFRFL
ncbi:MAG: hypothetical protein ACNYPF_00035 [Candidatus Puniceispirillales bacterium WSBS_2018_MAG_OTU23]